MVGAAKLFGCDVAKLLGCGEAKWLGYAEWGVAKLYDSCVA